jgi:hypothetical protein
MPTIAHAGHWFASLLYLAPVLLVILALACRARSDRRRGRATVQDDHGDSLQFLESGEATDC